MKVFEKHSEYGNPILEKSFRFGVRVVKFYLIRIKEEYQIKDILKQLLRSGTSIGANVAESQEAASKKDFINKLSISLKESRETDYWINVFYRTEIITQSEYESLIKDCDEIERLLTSSIRTARGK